MNKRKTEFEKLKTNFEHNLDMLLPWNEYPRPSLVRDSFVCLNGKWNFIASNDDGDFIQSEILVPFPPESRLSGVDISSKRYTRFTYTKTVFIDDLNSNLAILHFGAIDQYAKVFVNDCFVGEHHGGYLPFDFEITDNLKIGDNIIKVDVVDDLNKDYAYGKQKYNRGGMWYTPVSGIWQTVWLEYVPENYIKKLKIDVTLDTVNIRVLGGEKNKTIIVDNRKIDFMGDCIEFQVEKPEYWTPENPKLYYFTIISGKDVVKSYFALRTIDISKTNGCYYINLNSKPYFFNGILDQGYFSDGIYLPATSDGYKFDILNMKKLGFNMLRKHAKIEPEIFYYFCDLYGMIVFQDFVNSGNYNFIIDTALPTAFLKSGVLHYASEKRKNFFENDALATVGFLYNHPCVCYYTIFNEGWGQYSFGKIYDLMKASDSSRVWDTASGWFKYPKTDVKSEHIYFKPIKIKHKYKKPLVLSEFGGYSYKIPNHSFNKYKTYGYKYFHTKEDFQNALKELYLNQITTAIKNGLNATVFTQLSDVEDETNGLVTYDRKIIKIDESFMLDISNEIFNTFSKTVEIKR